MCQSFQSLYSWDLDGNCYSWTFIHLYTHKYPPGICHVLMLLSLRGISKRCFQPHLKWSHRRTVTAWLLAWIFQGLMQHGGRTRSVNCSNYALLSTVFRSWAHFLGCLHCWGVSPVQWQAFVTTSTPCSALITYRPARLDQKFKSNLRKAHPLDRVFPRGQIKVESGMSPKGVVFVDGWWWRVKLKGRDYRVPKEITLCSHTVISVPSAAELFQGTSG